MRNAKRLMAAFMTAAMVFTSSPFANVGNLAVFAAEEDASAESTVSAFVVTTDDGEVGYSDFMEALDATNSQDNVDKHATITLNEDAKVVIDTTEGEGSDQGEAVTTYEIIIPLVLVLNGHSLENNELLEGSSDLSTPGAICRGETTENGVLTQITFAEHAPNIVYNWKYSTTQDPVWKVVSAKGVCDNCETEDVVSDLGKTIYNADTDQYEYYAQSDLEEGEPKPGAKPLAVKAANSDTSGYALNGEVYLVAVNGVIQHKDGLPVVKANMVKIDSGASVDAKITVTPATDKEITDNASKIYYRDGETPYKSATYKADEEDTQANFNATCTKYGAIVYKVTVEDPDGKLVKEVYLRDHQAAAKKDHEKGALKGYQFLTKSASGYDTEIGAKDQAATQEKVAVKVTAEKVDNKTKYFYWSWDSLEKISGPTTTSNLSANVTVPVNAISEDGSFTYRPVYYCDYEGYGDDNINTIDGESVIVNPYPDATTSTEAEDAKHSTCTEWMYPSIVITYECHKNLTDVVKSKFTFTGAVKFEGDEEELVSKTAKK